MIEIIANIGGNWAVGSNPKQRALDLIESAADSGANTVCFELFNKLYSDPRMQKQVDPLRLDLDFVARLKERAERHRIGFIVSPMDASYVSPLEKLGTERYKVAPGDITYEPLLDELAKTKKQVLVSTAGAHYQEIKWAVSLLGEKTILIHGAPVFVGIESLNLRDVVTLAEEFHPVRTGYYANYVNPPLVASMTLYYVDVIEVKYTGGDNRGADSEYSYNPHAFGELVRLTREFEKAFKCGCQELLPDVRTRAEYYRDQNTWLRV